MIELIPSLIKYTAVFMCILYAYTKLLRIKLKAWDLFDIPLFIALSAGLHYVAVYVKILVPIGFLILGVAFLFLRFRKTFFETVTVGTMALGISIILMILSLIVGFFVAPALYQIEDETVKTIIQSVIVGITQVVCVFGLFKIKRFQSGIDPNGNMATFEILLFFSAGCIFALMIAYTENATYSIFETAILIIALFGLIFILWWRRHITYNYREAVMRQNVENLEKSVKECELNSFENELQVAVYSKLIHYLNRAVPDCALLAHIAAEKTDCTDVLEVRYLLDNIMRELNLTNDKSKLLYLPHTGEKLIDAPIYRLFISAERKNFKASAEISADVKSWFTDGKLLKEDINILLGYLCDNAMISALGSPNAKVHVQLNETINKYPLIRIYDSGEQFDEGVLAKLGLEQITTRADDGGNGIGLLTVFQILEKYGASFALDETPNNLGFAKYIEIVFDGLHFVRVFTLRKSVVTALAARKGIIVHFFDSSDGGTLRYGTNG